MRRSSRSLALAALPVVVLSQCAPQCVPAPVAAPFTVSYTDVPASVSFGGVRQLTRDGRFVVTVDGPEGLLVDLTGQSPLFELEEGSLVTADGGTEVQMRADGRAVFLRRIPDRTIDAWVDLPSPWLGEVRSVSDDGRSVVVAAWDGASRRTTFVADMRAGRIERVDAQLGVNWPDRSAFDALVSGDGTTTVFEYRLGSTTCAGCTQLWAARGSRPLQLVNMTGAVGTPTTGTSTIADLSTDGRFVLFSSNSRDLLGSTGSGDPRLYVRDLDARTTTELPVVIDDVVQQASISDDGQRITFARSPFAVAVLDRASGATVDITPGPQPPGTYLPPAEIEISGSGDRIVTSVDTAGRLLVADLVPG